MRDHAALQGRYYQYIVHIYMLWTPIVHLVREQRCLTLQISLFTRIADYRETTR